MSDYDIVIVGAGSVGLTFARAIADLPLKIAILEHKDAINVWSADDYALRVSAITPAAEFAYRRLGVWPGMASRRVSAFQKMFVWDPVGMGEITFNVDELGLPSIGHIIENDVINQALYEQLQQYDNIDWHFAVRGESFYPQGDVAELKAQGGSFKAPLFVAADGAHSWLRQQVGIEQKVKPYQHCAIVATVMTEKAHEHTAWQCFLPSGPLAFLPLQAQGLNPNLCSIVWSAEPELAEELMALTPAEFNSRLSEAYGFKLGNASLVSSRASFPLVMRQAKQYSANNVVLIGDAAHTIHPLAGQGLNLGIMDALVLAELMADAQARGRSLSSQSLLRRYERSRKLENQSMAAAMQGFKSLFNYQSGIISTVRSLGLSLTNRCQPVKHLLMRRAMGLSGERPKVAQFHPTLFSGSD